MAFSKLAPELQDEIVKCLSKDTMANSTLLSTSLTCRSLACISQKYIFAEVVLALDASEKPEKTRRTRTVLDFHEIVKSSPHIAGYVRRLKLVGLCRQGEDWQLQESALVACLPFLCSLNALVVTAYDSSKISCKVLSALILLLKSNSLSYLDFTRMPSAVLDHCSNATHLSLSLLWEEFEANRSGLVKPEVQSEQQPPVALVSLRVFLEYEYKEEGVTELEQPGGTYSWLLQPVNRCRLSSLRRLIVEADESMEEHRYTRQILEVCKDTLEEFAFYPSEATPTRDDIHIVQEPIDLGILTALRKFYVRCSPWMLPWYTDLLRTVPVSGASRIEELVVQALLPTGTDWCMQFPAVFRSFSQAISGRFPKLRKFHARMAFMGEHPGGLALTNRLFSLNWAPRLDESDVLDLSLSRGTSCIQAEDLYVLDVRNGIWDCEHRESQFLPVRVVIGAGSDGQ